MPNRDAMALVHRALRSAGIVACLAPLPQAAPATA